MTKATHRLVTKDGEELNVYHKFGSEVDWWTTDDSRGFGNVIIYSLTPLPIEPEEPETFDWMRAMRLVSDRVPVEYKSRDGTWIHLRGTKPRFDSESVYRRAPKAPPAPKVKEYWYLWQEHGFISNAYHSIEEARIDCTNQMNAIVKITVTEGEKLPRVEVLEAN